MILISKFSKGIRFSLCVIDIFTEYASAVPLKDEKVVTIVNSFQNILNAEKRKSNKIWVEKEENFIKDQ